MVSEATRGVKFVIKTELDPNVSKPFEALEAHVAAIEKRLSGLKIPAPVAARIAPGSVTQSGSNGAQTANGSNGSATGGMPPGARVDADKLSRDRERSAERAMRTEARWNRMAESAIAKREAAEKRASAVAERDAKRVADAQIREQRRVEQERERDEQRRIREGNRHLAALVRTGQQAVEQDRIRSERQAQTERESRKRANDARRDREERERIQAEESAARTEEVNQQTLEQQRRDLQRAERERRNNADREERTSHAERIERQQQLREGIDATIESVSRLGRGFAQLGLIGETDLHRITNTMLGVQGTIDTFRGSIESFRSIRGGLHAVGAIHSARGLGPAAALSAGPGMRIAGHLLNLAGISSFGVTGGLGLAGAGVTALAAGGIGLAGSIADRRRGVPGQVGGFWDTIGTRAASTSSRVTGYGIRAFGRMEAMFNEPYGLTSREQELRNEGVLERTATSVPGSLLFGAMGQNALSAMRIERQERFTSEEIRNRARMRDLRSTIYANVGSREAEQRELQREFEAQRYGIRAENIQTRGQNIAGQLGSAFGRQQEFHGELAGLQARRAIGEFVDPAQLARAAAEHAREEGLVASFAHRQLGNLATAGASNYRRGRELSQELHAARQRQAGLGEFDTAEKEGVAREILSITERIKQNEEERLKIADKRHHLEIDGAQRELALQQQSLAAAKQAAESLRGQRQSAIERFGNLNPMQRRATLEAARMFNQGIELQEPQLNLLRTFPEVFGPQLRRRAEKKFQEEGGEELFKLGGFDQRIGAAEAEEKRQIAINVNAVKDLNIKLDANTEAMSKELTEKLVPIFKSVMQTAVNSVAEQIQMAQGRDFGQAVERTNAAGGP